MRTLFDWILILLNVSLLGGCSSLARPVRMIAGMDDESIILDAMRGRFTRNADIEAALLDPEIVRKIDVLRIRGTYLFDLSSLERLPYLESLYLYDTSNVTDYSVLRRLPHLRSVVIVGTHLRNVASMSNLTQLQSLHFRNCSGLRDLEAVGTMSGLEELWFQYCDVEDLRPLAALANVHNLSLTGCKSVEDITPLSSMTKLAYVYLAGASGVGDLRPLENLPLHTLTVPRGSYRRQEIGKLADRVDSGRLRVDFEIRD